VSSVRCIDEVEAKAEATEGLFLLLLAFRSFPTAGGRGDGGNIIEEKADLQAIEDIFF